MQLLDRDGGKGDNDDEHEQLLHGDHSRTHPSFGSIAEPVYSRKWARSGRPSVHRHHSAGERPFRRSGHDSNPIGR